MIGVLAKTARIHRQLQGNLGYRYAWGCLCEQFNYN